MNRSLHEVGGPNGHVNGLRRSRDALRADGWTIVSELPYPDNEEDYRTNPDQRRLAGRGQRAREPSSAWRHDHHAHS